MSSPYLTDPAAWYAQNNKEDSKVEEQAKLHASLAKAQGAMKNPERNRTVTVRSDKGSYTFDYATLDNIIDTARKALSDNGIAVSQCLARDQNGASVLVTRLLHADGGTLVNEMPVTLPQPDERGRQPRIQELGSVITYARRYALCAMLNIAAEEDDDGAAGESRDTKSRAATPSKADPKADAKDDVRSAYKTMRDAINASADPMALAKILLDGKSTLAEIKQVSEAAYSELMKSVADKKASYEKEAK